MTNTIPYKTILKKAIEFRKGVEKEYKLIDSTKWSYYIAKAILNPHTDIKKISFDKAKESHGNNISRQIKKADYLDMARRFVKYVETHKRLPNNIQYKNLLMRVRDYTYMFSLQLSLYHENKNKAPAYLNFTSKAFVKPTENKNTVFTKWVNKFKFTPERIDDVCDYVLEHFNYLFYFDDVRSNAEVIEDMAGNCTDLLQMLINMAEAMGYEWKVIHTECRQSATGHVYGMFRREDINNGEWFVRDISCIADESRYCVWCEVPSGGYKLAENPSWFLANLRR